MNTITVPIPGKPYPIYVGKNAIAGLGRLIAAGKIGQDAVLVSTDNLLSMHGKRLQAELRKVCSSVLVLKVPDSEKSKNASLALKLIAQVTRFDMKKRLFFVAFGGGVVGDLTGFMAAIYKRGVPYIQIPTTLLAQIDSSIGGKTGVDTGLGKNLVGAFYQPRFVLSDTEFLKTLPRAQIQAGLSEAVKYAAIEDKALFTFIEKNLKKILSLDPKAIEKVILTCARIKARTVGLDEYDKRGVRVKLNFGHTFGHAIEAASCYKVSHGEAVAIGMVCAAEVSVKLGLLKEKDAAELKGLLERIGLPTKIKKIGKAPILNALAHDKKFTKGGNRFVLINRIGATMIVEDVPEELIKEVVT